jgi:hypothetical protein
MVSRLRTDLRFSKDEWRFRSGSVEGQTMGLGNSLSIFGTFVEIEENFVERFECLIFKWKLAM